MVHALDFPKRAVDVPGKVDCAAGNEFLLRLVATVPGRTREAPRLMIAQEHLRNTCRGSAWIDLFHRKVGVTGDKSDRRLWEFEAAVDFEAPDAMDDTRRVLEVF